MRRMDNADIRRTNLRILIQEFGANSVTEKLQMERSQLSQISGRNPTRNIGPTLARKIEIAFGRPHGWLDVAHGRPGLSLRTSAGELIEIPKLAIRASAGTGVMRPEVEEVVGLMQVRTEWVQRNITCSNPKNLRTIMAHGDSMAPTFSDGDIVWIDTGVHLIEIDGVYVVAIGDELYIKRFQRRPIEKALWMISDNKAKYEPQIVDRLQLKQLEVLGRAVWAWTGEKL